MSGWIRVERDVFGHDFFDPAPMSEREAWLWMVATARWENSRHKVGKTMCDVPRGSFMVTLREMQLKFMWRSDTKVRNFLKRLEGEGMIERTTVGTRNAPKTHVTICNYNEYQSFERTKNVPKTYRERTKNAVINKETKKQTTSNEVVRAILTEIIPENIADAFIAHRRQMKKPVTENAANAMVRKLEGHHDPGAVLTDSIANGWQGIFPQKIKPQFKAINGGQNEPSHTDATLNAIAIAARMRRSQGANSS